MEQEAIDLAIALSLADAQPKTNERLGGSFQLPSARMRQMLDAHASEMPPCISEQDALDAAIALSLSDASPCSQRGQPSAPPKLPTQSAPSAASGPTASDQALWGLPTQSAPSTASGPTPSEQALWGLSASAYQSATPTSTDRSSEAALAEELLRRAAEMAQERHDVEQQMLRDAARLFEIEQERLIESEASRRHADRIAQDTARRFKAEQEAAQQRSRQVLQNERRRFQQQQRPSSQFRVVQKDSIPNGWHLATEKEVRAHLDCVKGLLVRWSIVKLANGMKIDGCGYGGRIQRIPQGQEKHIDEVVVAC